MHTHSKWLQSFLWTLLFKVQPRCSTVLFSDIGLQCLREHFLHWNSNDLPTHSYHFCVGEVDRLKLKLKDLGSRLTQCFRYPVCMRKHFLTCCLSIIWKWLGYIGINFYQSFTNVHRFPGISGNGDAQAVNTRPLSLLPCGLGTRLVCDTDLIEQLMSVQTVCISLSSIAMAWWSAWDLHVIFTVEILPKDNNFSDVNTQHFSARQFNVHDLQVCSHVVVTWFAYIQ